MGNSFERGKHNKARAEKIIRSLEKRNMKVIYYEDSKEAVQHICTLIKEGDLVGLGGSETNILISLSTTNN